MGDIPGIPGQSTEVWVFFDQGAATNPYTGKLERFPLYAPAGTKLPEMLKLILSHRMLIKWEKTNGFLK
jgi:hypothetical protein